MAWIVYAGAHDRKRPLAHGRENPHSRLAIIPNAAHLSNLEQPEAFNQIVATFAQELDKEKQT
jgi:pimeloyl-ACP methyl ester carboxylesterase